VRSTESAEESPSPTVTLAPNPANRCFGCGGANEEGMKLTFVQDNEKRRIVGRFVLGKRYQGGGGMGHGGIIATLLDEAMGKVCRFREVRAVTAELTVEYLKPVSVEQEIYCGGMGDGTERAKSVPGRRDSKSGRRCIGKGQSSFRNYR
jgi:acyl-coenzyme A thioesterase PaaI-like protein